MSANTMSALSPLHILLVDDEPMAIDIMETHFQQYGFIIDTAADGNQALSLMESRMPDLVLCDRIMPGMTGAELLRIVRDRGSEPGNAQWNHPLFIFVTALTDRRDKYAMMSLSPDAYLTKPIVLTEVDRVIANIIERRRAAQA